MSVLSSLMRNQLIQQLEGETFDLLIIGGGATGAGIALDAASRGMKTLLVEKQDFAAGTSSRSTKLIHGGLRYLKQFEIALVREVGRERATVHDLAPHLVVNEKMLLPLIKGGTYGKLSTSFGLMVYDVLAGVESEDQRIMLSKAETLMQEPLLPEDILEGSGLYAEYRTDDARLTIEVIKTAATFGARSVNYMEATDFIYEKERVVGATCKDLLSGEPYTIRARQVLSAAGPWVDDLRKKNKSLEGKRLHLTKGVHIVVPREKFPLKQSIYYDVPDGRMIFSIPRGKITYIGTTDTDYSGPKENPRTLKEDVDYLLKGANHTFRKLNLKPEDVISSWAGLRPLIHEDGKSASELSRKDEIFVSSSKLISIAGGKLTGYRKMAERAVDRVARRLRKKFKLEFKDCYTDKIVLMGGGFDGPKGVNVYKKEVATTLAADGLSAYEAEYLVHNYGKQTDAILVKFREYVEGNPPQLALARAELWFGIHNEMIATPMDFFSRRTGRLYFDIESVRNLQNPLLEEFRTRFNWNDIEFEQYRVELEQAVSEASTFPQSITY